MTRRMKVEVTTLLSLIIVFTFLYFALQTSDSDGLSKAERPPSRVAPSKSPDESHAKSRPSPVSVSQTRYQNWTPQQLMAEYERISAQGIKSFRDNEDAGAVLIRLAECDAQSVFSILEAGIRAGASTFTDPEFILLAKIAENDSSALIQWISKISNSATSKHSLVASAINALATQADVPEVREFLKQHIEANPDVIATMAVGTMVGLGSSESAINDAIEFINDLNVSANVKATMMTEIARIIATGRPEMAMAMIETYGNGMSAGDYSDAMIRVFRANPDLLHRHLEGASGANLMALVNNSVLISELTRTNNIEIAKLLLKKMPLTAGTRKQTDELLRLISASDPGMAVQIVADMPDGAGKVGAFAMLYGNTNGASRQMVVAQIERMPQEQRTACMRNVAAALAISDFDGANALAAEATPDNQQNMYREIARASAYKKPENAVRVLEDPVLSQKIGADFRAEMLNTTVQTWAKQDLQAAQVWVEKLSPSDQTKGVQGLMNTWMKTDPVAASDWLAKMPAGPVRDAGARQVITQIKDTDPEMAEKWRESLTPQPVGNQ